jgi:Tfp pilus assembly protein PilP
VLGAVVIVATVSTDAHAQGQPAPAQAAPKPAAQRPAASPAATPPAATPPAAADPAPQGLPAAGLPLPENYTYNADGRRDPFTSLIGTGAAADSRTPIRGEGGAASFGVGDISVRGVMQSRGSLVAMVEGPNKKTYIVHQGDKLLDGVIKTITPQGLVVVQEVNDPLSLVKQREVSKLLRSLEGGK